MIAFTALVLVNILDGWLTYRIISTGGKELNPIMATVMDILGVIPALVIIKMAMLGILYVVNIGDWLWLVVALFSAICIWNIKEMKWKLK